MEAQEKNAIGTIFEALRRLAPFARISRPERVYSVREANNAVSSIVEAALRGSPQIIHKRNKERVLVICEKTIVEMAQASAAPRSFADMLPVTETEPPLGRLVVKEHPGRERIRLTSEHARG